jgi:hypothetical protein
VSGATIFGYVVGNPLGLTDPTGLAAPALLIPIVIQVCRQVLMETLAAMAGVGAAAVIVEVTECTDNCPPGPGGKDPCKGLREQMQDHERKLREYIANPMSMDNKGFLAGALAKGDQALYDTIYTSRLASLQWQIANFKKQLEECERKNGGL